MKNFLSYPKGYNNLKRPPQSVIFILNWYPDVNGIFQSSVSETFHIISH